MAIRLEKITSIKVFPNTDGAAKWGNSKFTPYKDGSPADIHLSASKKYRVSVFENDDGSLGISITEPIEQQAGDNLHDNVQQGGMKKLAVDAAIRRDVPIDDDIPF